MFVAAACESKVKRGKQGRKKDENQVESVAGFI